MKVVEIRQNFASQKKGYTQLSVMDKKFEEEETDRLQLAQYCQRRFRQKADLPNPLSMLPMKI